MNINNCIEIGQILSNQLAYDKNRVIELILEEYRLSSVQTAVFIKSVFTELNPEDAGFLMLEFFQLNQVKEALEESFNIRGAELKKLMNKLEGIYEDPVTTNTFITALRANDFGHEYRAYIGLENIGNRKPGWGYLVPGEPGTNAMMKIATMAKRKGLEIYVYGKIDDDGEKIKIFELGIK